jgi:hypothetical protein
MEPTTYKETIMDFAKKAVARTGQFVEDHKYGLGVITGLTIGLMLNRLALLDHDNFLKDHDLYDKFYQVSDEE